MSKTVILTPFANDESNGQEIDSERRTNLEKLYRQITTLMKDETNGIDMSYNAFLHTGKLQMSEQQYIQAIRTSLDQPQVFLKRDPIDTRVNAYMRTLLSAWGANHDLQFVLDPYPCAAYIVSYISKSQKGISALC